MRRMRGRRFILLLRVEEVVHGVSPGVKVGVTSSCAASHEHWELDSCLLGEQYTLLIAEPSLQP